MKTMVAYCGINCSECPAYIATQTNDDTKRKQVAEEWQKVFNPNIKPEAINCDGCTSLLNLPPDITFLLEKIRDVYKYL